MVYGDLIASVARRNPDRVGIVFEDTSLTWREANERVNRLANALVSLGLEKGERVAILAQNSHRYAETYFALAKAGLVSVPLNWQSPLAEASYIVNDSGARALIADEPFLPLAAEIASRAAAVRHVIGMGAPGPGGLEYERLLVEHPGDEPRVPVAPDDLRSFVYTSGTTGMPKGCITTHRQSLANFANFLIEIRFPQEQPTLLPVPFFTGFGAHLCFDAPYTRSPLVILRKFEPRAVLQAIERHRIGHLSLVPTMINSLVNAPEIGKYDLSSLRLIAYGGSPISPEVLKRAMKVFGCDFCQMFGTAEAGGLIAYLTPDDHRLDGSELKEKRLYSTGREALFAHIRLVDDDGREVGPNEPGEVTVKTESIFSGYWNQPEKTAETLRNGWVHTGDIAYRDEEGYLFIVDRKKEMIVTGGINVYPAEIEAVLYTHPAIAQAAVIGVPDPHWGEAVKAVVELKPGASATEQEIIAFCGERLAGFKKPKSVDFESGLVSSSGKVAKRALRERYWKGEQRRVH